MKKYILQYGDENPKKIMIAQICLREDGSKIELNGEYTIGMVSAVAAFQKRNGLEVTGKIDRKTWWKLRRKVSTFRLMFGR